MRAVKGWLVLLVVLAMMPLVGGEPAPDERPAKAESALSLTVNLLDGSRIIGSPDISAISVQTTYAKLDLALKQVSSIEIEADRELTVIKMSNGDRFKGAMLLKTLELQTVFGRVSIGFDQIIKIDVKAATQPK